MTNEKQEKITEIVEILKQLDKQSLLLIQNGSQMLKVKEDLEKERKEEC